jgi:hypothetical protein
MREKFKLCLNLAECEKNRLMSIFPTFLINYFWGFQRPQMRRSKLWNEPVIASPLQRDNDVSWKGQIFRVVWKYVNFAIEREKTKNLVFQFAELTEQREESKFYLYYPESWRKKTKSTWAKIPELRSPIPAEAPTRSLSRSLWLSPAAVDFQFGEANVRKRRKCILLHCYIVTLSTFRMCKTHPSTIGYYNI